MKKLVWVFIVLAVGGCRTSESPSNSKIKVSLSLLYEGQPLVLAEKRYRSASGDIFTIERFQFYMSNVKFRNKETGEVFAVPNSYHLIERKPDSHLFELSFEVPAGRYNEMEFAVGVDPARNLSTDQVGDLDPSNNMAWDWNTGYKFLLLEGKIFPPSGNPRGLVYHIGTDENYRVIKLPLNTVIDTQSRLQHIIDIEAEVSGIFNTPNVIPISRHSTVMMGPVAALVADNYGQSVFRLRKVTY
ncbi:MAG: hypothetical protein RMJ44_06565 [Cytophagales bacterium]|nr:hypothetical protein [Bernardetiaceae bacterium]MDW8210734.1 hypothetical protein [Cytophagales bacterium]